MRFDLTELTVTELDDIERDIGQAVPDVVQKGGARKTRDLVVALLRRNNTEAEAREIASRLKVSDIVIDINGSDLPSMFNDYIPDMGGRTADRFVCLFAGPPWHWPPDVTRRQRIRDLRLLQDAFDGWSPNG